MTATTDELIRRHFTRSQRWEGTAEDQAAYAAKHGTRQHLAWDDETDIQIAARARMLMRTDLEHEAVCSATRDRICALTVERAALLSDLKRVTEHLATWAADHSLESTSETWAALHCARETIAKLEAGSAPPSASS